MKRSFSLLILFVLTISACDKNSTTLVQTEGRKLLLNNKTYQIKGICYHPVPKGETIRDFSTITQGLAAHARSWNQYHKSICTH